MSVGLFLWAILSPFLLTVNKFIKVSPRNEDQYQSFLWYQYHLDYL